MGDPEPDLPDTTVQFIDRELIHFADEIYVGSCFSNTNYHCMCIPIELKKSILASHQAGSLRCSFFKSRSSKEALR